MGLTAQLEKQPTEDQILQIVGPKSYQSMCKVLAKYDQSITKVIFKVLEDVEYTKELRRKSSSKMAQWREKKKNKSHSVTSNVTNNVTSKDNIREHKIREEKGNTGLHKGLQGSPGQYLFNKYRSLNKGHCLAYPKWLNIISAEISAALANGWKASAIEQRMYDTAGKGIKPWELFKKEDEEGGKLDGLRKRLEGHQAEIQKLSQM